MSGNSAEIAHDHVRDNGGDVVHMDVLVNTRGELLQLIEDFRTSRNEVKDWLRTNATVRTRLRDIIDSRVSLRDQERTEARQRLDALLRTVGEPPSTPPAPAGRPATAPTPPASGDGRGAAERAAAPVMNFIERNPGTSLAIGGGLALGLYLATKTQLLKGWEKTKKVLSGVGVFLAGTAAVGLAYLGIKGYRVAERAREAVDRLSEELQNLRNMTQEELDRLAERIDRQGEQARFVLAERSLQSTKDALPAIARERNVFTRRRDLLARANALTTDINRLNGNNLTGLTKNDFLASKGLQPGPINQPPFRIRYEANRVVIDDEAEALYQNPDGATAANLFIIHRRELNTDIRQANQGALVELMRRNDLRDLPVDAIIGIANKSIALARTEPPLNAPPYLGNIVNQDSFLFLARAIKAQVVGGADGYELFRGRRSGSTELNPRSLKVFELLEISGQFTRVSGRYNAAFGARRPASPIDSEERRQAWRDTFREALDIQGLNVDVQAGGVRASIAALDPALSGNGKEAAFVRYCVEKAGTPLASLNVHSDPALTDPAERDMIRAGVAALQARMLRSTLTLRIYGAAKASAVPGSQQAFEAGLVGISAADALQLHLAIKDVEAGTDDGSFRGAPSGHQSLGRIQLILKVAEIMSRSNPLAARNYYNEMMPSRFDRH
jgi:hypothetical protein